MMSPLARTFALALAILAFVSTGSHGAPTHHLAAHRKVLPHVDLGNALHRQRREDTSTQNSDANAQGSGSSQPPDSASTRVSFSTTVPHAAATSAPAPSKASTFAPPEGSTTTTAEPDATTSTSTSSMSSTSSTTYPTSSSSTGSTSSTSTGTSSTSTGTSSTSTPEAETQMHEGADMQQTNKDADGKSGSGGSEHDGGVTAVVVVFVLLAIVLAGFVVAYSMRQNKRIAELTALTAEAEA